MALVHLDRSCEQITFEDVFIFQSAILSPELFSSITIRITERIASVDGTVTDGNKYEFTFYGIGTSINDVLYWDGVDSTKTFLATDVIFSPGIYSFVVEATYAGTGTITSWMGCAPLDCRLICDLVDQAEDAEELVLFYFLERAQECDCECKKLPLLYKRVRDKIDVSDECNNCK